jgi:hypothetical protein
LQSTTSGTENSYSKTTTPKPIPKVPLTSSEKMQIYLVLISIFVGFYLYLISRWDDGDATNLLAQYKNKLEEEIMLIKNKGLNENPITPIPNLE